MLPALAYRQALFVLDLLLVGLLAAVGFVAVKGMVLVGSSGIATPVDAEFVPDPMPQVGPLSTYETILASNLFGNPPAKPVDAPPPEPVNVIEETGLPLKLGGTVVSGALSTAMIEDESRRQSDVYYLGQEIIPKVTLVEVRKNAIVIDNGNTGKREILRREDTGEEGTLVASTAATPQVEPIVRHDRHETVVKRAEVMNELQTNATTLYSQVRPEFKKDAQGNTIGITSSNISAVPLATEIGLKDNDVVTSINGEKIDSEEKLGLLLQKYGNAKTVRLGIERGGRPQVLNLRLE